MIGVLSSFRTPARVPRRRLLQLAGCLSVQALACLSEARSASASEAEPPFRLIVHPKNPAASVDAAFVADVFLKKASNWQDGQNLEPVDLRPDATLRQKFSQAVLKRSVAAVRSYWQQRIFSGRGVPPPELDSDEAVVSFVLSHRGGLGYVSSAAKLGDAKVLRLR